jgi:hypothetical protein
VAAPARRAAQAGLGVPEVRWGLRPVDADVHPLRTEEDHDGCNAFNAGALVIVVSLCDLTGTMVKPWANAGFDCYCVDVQHSIRRDRQDGNIHYVWGDVRSWAPPAPVAFLAAFPPCTHVAVSGAQDWAKKGLPMLRDSLELFNACHQVAQWSGAPYMIENPVGALSTHVRDPDFIFDPYEFGGYLTPPGDAYTKRTCLWTGNGFLMPVKRPVEPTEGSLMHVMAPGPERANERSATPAGFARAVFEANVDRVMARWATTKLEAA